MILITFGHHGCTIQHILAIHYNRAAKRVQHFVRNNVTIFFIEMTWRLAGLEDTTVLKVRAAHPHQKLW